MKIILSIIFCFFIVNILIFSINAPTVEIIENIQKKNQSIDDINPFSDEKITVTIKEIRSYHKTDKFSPPDFYVLLNINGEDHRSKIWRNHKYVREDWSVTVDIPENLEEVIITIKLFDSDILFDRICDIAPNDISDKYYNYAYLVYDLKSGHWAGSDYTISNSGNYDASGYGRLNGWDDGSIGTIDRDCEIIFDITQSDPDGDGIPTWTENNDFDTDPLVDDTGRDDDGDGVPIEWEFRWGYQFDSQDRWFYDPFEWEDHHRLDPDSDGLDNVEEYLTSEWGSDPFRKDIFLELDQMEIRNGSGSYVPQLAKDMLIDAFARHNILFHIDDYSEDQMDGGELIPFKETVTLDDLPSLYYYHFLDEDYDNWRQGVFHYGLVVHKCNVKTAFAFWGGDENYRNIDSFLLTSEILDNKIYEFRLANILVNKKINRDYRRSVVYASVMMHETGHVLGIDYGNTPGCDNAQTYFPWQIGWWKYRNYKSCMNYAYTYALVDYSDGSHGRNDYDDWGRIDLNEFQSE